MTLSVFLCVSRTDYGAATASGGTSQLEGNDAGRNNAVISDAVDTGTLLVVQYGRTTFPDHHSGDKYVDNHSTDEPGL